MARIDPTAHVAPSAVVTGDVTIGPRTVVLHGAVLNGEKNLGHPARGELRDKRVFPEAARFGGLRNPHPRKV